MSAGDDDDAAHGLDASFALHDDLVARRGVEVWIGAEPTFTRADSHALAWTCAPEGDDKLERAQALAGDLAARLPNATMSRVAGRQYPEEKAPRFAFGVRWPEAQVGAPATSEPPAVATGDAVVHAIATRESSGKIAAVARRDSSPTRSPSDPPLRDSSPSLGNLRTRSPSDPPLRDSSPSLGNLRTRSPSDPPQRDSSPSLGNLRTRPPSDPPLGDSSTTLANLRPGAAGAPKRRAATVPPVPPGPTPAGARDRADATPFAPPAEIELGTDRWLSVTPDPGVVEVNMAPCPSATGFVEQARHVFAAARAAGLHAQQFRWNGQIADSGGGGQITLGGSRPHTSPFVRYPHVLPAMIRYFNNHPSLSYWFANECVGSASQGPRPDEGMREHRDELGVTLAHLERCADRGELAPEQLWTALSPLLVDGAGNSHRAEINVEKLWNPHVVAHGTRHGKMGVVELRAIRMPERPEMMGALAVLLRSIVARLAVADYREQLVDWHEELHDRFALPAALAIDLRHVLGDLDTHALGVPAELRRELEAWRPPGIACRLGDATLTIRPALEFWPLVGDVASQERAGARCVDASTERYELAIEGPGPDRVAIGGRWVTLRPLGANRLRAIGVRRRAYVPTPGLHPGLAATDPLTIEWTWEGRAQRIALWAWKPDGGAYDGLPADASAALARRAERIQIQAIDGPVTATGFWPEARPFTVDLRG